MPQMSPLMWLLLMVMVVLVYMLFGIVSYFFFSESKIFKKNLDNKVNFKGWSW